MRVGGGKPEPVRGGKPVGVRGGQQGPRGGGCGAGEDGGGGDLGKEKKLSFFLCLHKFWVVMETFYPILIIASLFNS